jgi:hypothetical protein
MSGMTSPLISDELKQPRLIEYLSRGAYRVRLMSNSGDVLDTIGRAPRVRIVVASIDQPRGRR